MLKNILVSLITQMLIRLISCQTKVLLFSIFLRKHEREDKGIPRTNMDAHFPTRVSVTGLLTLSAVTHLKHPGRSFTAASQQGAFSLFVRQNSIYKVYYHGLV